MSASDSLGYFVELGEYNLIIAKTKLNSRPRIVEAVREVWLGDTPGVEAALGALKPAGTTAKAIALFRLKGHGTFLASPAQGQSIANAAAAEAFIRSELGAENTPANWSWCNAANGQPQQSGARWLLDAIPSVHTDEAVAKLRAWSFELVRCQSAPLTLAGGLAAVAKQDTVLLADVSEHRTFLLLVSAQGVTASATLPVGFDALAGATQTALGLKFRGSAARLMFNESYDFSETGTKIVEPLANAIRDALPSLGKPTHLVVGGALAGQTWITQSIAGATALQPFKIDAAAWASANAVTFSGDVDPAKISPSWLGTLHAISTFDHANPAAVKPWSALLTGTPVSAPPAIILPPAAEKPAIIPAIIQEPAKPAAAPATAPAPAQAKPTPPPPKPAVVITPPAKPATPAAPVATPAAQGKPAAPSAETAKPAAKPQPAAPAKPAPAPAPAPAKTPATAKPAPAPAPITKNPPLPVAAAKPATAAPFPPKRNNLPLIIGVAALLVIGVVGYVIYSSNKKEQADKAAQAEQKQRLELEAAARRQAEEAARKEAEARKKAEEEARLQAIAAEEARRKAEQDTARNTTQRLLSARGNLTVASEPAGATVVVGELAPRTTPASLRDLRLGSYSVTLTLPGYDTEQREVEIKENETTDLGTIVLKRQVGSIDVTSTPPGMAYEVRPAGALFVNPNEIRTGQTPATLSDLPVGNYQITVTRSGWAPHSATVALERNATAKVEASFPAGTVVIKSTPAGATVLLNNQITLGTTPLTVTDAAPGPVSYTLSLAGFDPVNLTGRLEGGKTLSLEARLLESDRLMKLSELDERPAPIKQVEPEFTPDMYAQGGSANVSFIVGTDGIPTDLRIEQASSPAFGRTCLLAITKWRFKPGVKNGNPVRTRVTAPFKINPQ